MFFQSVTSEKSYLEENEEEIRICFSWQSFVNAFSIKWKHV